MNLESPTDGCREGEPGRAKRLRAATHSIHDRLDSRIMATDLFASIEHYGCFLRVQHAFHRDIDALYDSALLSEMLPHLASRRRLPLIAADLVDLRIDVARTDDAPLFGERPDIATALGWLYVAEGSNLGAAFLFKDAAKLKLSETFGARHLAPAPEGRAVAWRTFTSALDAVNLTDEEEKRVIGGAADAFARVHGLVETLMPLNAETGPSKSA